MCSSVSYICLFVHLSINISLSSCLYAVVKQLRGQSVMHQPQLTLSTDNSDDVAAAADDDVDDELDENVIGKY